MKVTIIGAGNAGCCLAFHLGLLGHDIALYAHPTHSETLWAIKKANCEIEATDDGPDVKGAIVGTQAVDLLTTDIKSAVEYSNMIIVTIPSPARQEFFQMASEYLIDNQIIVSMCGNFASINYESCMKKWNMSKKLHFVDTDTIPYVCRRLKGNRVSIFGIKQCIGAAVYPKNANTAPLQQLQNVLRFLKVNRMSNVIEAAFNNANIMYHPAVTALNAGWIESTGGNFSFYKHGFSSPVCRMIEAVDEERLALGKRLNLKMNSIVQINHSLFGPTGMKKLYDQMQARTFYHSIKAPCTIYHRYIYEDVCYLLLSMREIGTMLNFPMPATDVLISLLEILTGEKLEPAVDLSFVKDMVPSKENVKMNRNS